MAPANCEAAAMAETEPSGPTPGNEQEHPRETPANWAELVERIQHNDPSGMEDLYRVFARGIRFYLCRQLGPQELDDRVHDTFLIVVQAIRRGELREPERLMGFIRTVVRRQVAAHIDSLVHSRREEVELNVNTAPARPDLES